MSLSLDQLRSALADHADTADLSAADRLAGVRRAVRTRRRRQATAITSGLAGGAIVALFVGTGVLSLDRGQRPVAPANPTVTPPAAPAPAQPAPTPETPAPPAK